MRLFFVQSVDIQLFGAENAAAAAAAANQLHILSVSALLARTYVGTYIVRVTYMRTYRES